jgi:hypothetical protein
MLVVMLVEAQVVEAHQDQDWHPTLWFMTN